MSESSRERLPSVRLRWSAREVPMLAEWVVTVCGVLVSAGISFALLPYLVDPLLAIPLAVTLARVSQFVESSLLQRWYRVEVLEPPSTPSRVSAFCPYCTMPVVDRAFGIEWLVGQDCPTCASQGRQVRYFAGVIPGSEKSLIICYYQFQPWPGDLRDLQTALSKLDALRYSDNGFMFLRTDAELVRPE